ncbi:hypothetical protein KAU40_01495 [Candidatus Parcubacteria bacterium]|nr:hypothetical protein [Candidatus Parcubacteria bacterium]
MEEKNNFQRLLESISPEEKELLKKYSTDELKYVDEKDISALQELQKRTGTIWNSGSEGIKPGKCVGLSIHGGLVYDALFNKNP